MKSRKENDRKKMVMMTIKGRNREREKMKEFCILTSAQNGGKKKIAWMLIPAKNSKLYFPFLALFQF